MKSVYKAGKCCGANPSDCKPAPFNTDLLKNTIWTCNVGASWVFDPTGKYVMYGFTGYGSFMATPPIRIEAVSDSMAHPSIKATVPYFYNENKTLEGFAGTLPVWDAQSMDASFSPDMTKMYPRLLLRCPGGAKYGNGFIPNSEDFFQTVGDAYVALFGDNTTRSDGTVITAENFGYANLRAAGYSDRGPGARLAIPGQGRSRVPSRSVRHSQQRWRLPLRQIYHSWRLGLLS